MRHAFHNARMLAPAGVVDGHVLLVDGDRIADIVPAGDPRAAAGERHDLAGQLLLPGFIDAQVNGGGGVLFNDAPTVEGIRAIGAAHARLGTTGFLPTRISDTPEVLARALAAVDAAIAAGGPGLLGIHVEGPCLAESRRGVHAAAHLRKVTETV